MAESNSRSTTYERFISSVPAQRDGQHPDRVLGIGCGPHGDIGRPGMNGRAAGVGEHRLAERMRVPGLHRRPLVGGGECGQHRVTAANVLEVPFDDLGLVTDRVASKIPPHRIDRIDPHLSEERCGATAVLLCEGRSREVDPTGHDGTYSTAMDGTRSTELVALGHAGSDHYAGLETFPNPGVAHVELTSDELVSVCPVTGQPD